MSMAQQLSHPRPFAALALHDLVALFDEAFAFAVLAFLLFLDVRAFFIRHDVSSVTAEQKSNNAAQ
ncbi:MAG: hypothetical protein K2X60_03825 [Xanthobacteraceae bacterium]|nr:hypothetical protein [Xanthobacteraceae bacterium]